MASYTGVSVDAEGILHDWLNSLTTTLVGETRPVTLGFYYELLRSPYRGAFGVISRVAGTEGLGVEAPSDMARISAAFYAPTRQAAAAAAVAYANTLRGISTLKPVQSGVTIQLADSIAGPLYIPNVVKHEQQYLVDADVYFTS